VTLEALDPHDVRLVQRATGLLGAFNTAGVLAAADVHVALRLGELGGEADEEVLLAAALAVRAPRLGHVCADLATIEDRVTVDADFPVDLPALPWPRLGDWLARLSASSLVATGDGRGRPLRLGGSLVYLDRYWQEERQVAADLGRRGAQEVAGVDDDVLAEGLVRLFGGDEPELQRLAAASAVLRRFAVVGGGPGTGKTTTVAGILALLDEQSAGKRPPLIAPPLIALPLIALAAPTGKAAARLQEAVNGATDTLAVSEGIGARLRAQKAVTLHRLLGWQPGSHGRFRHHRTNQLPHDVVIVDETSMISLSMMARLVEAVRAEARLVLVGDPEQLASVEAGAVLGDVVGPAADGLLVTEPARRRLAKVTGGPVPATDPPAGAVSGDGIVVLRRGHRFAGTIADLADAIRRGDADAAVDVLRLGDGVADVRRRGGEITWLDVDAAEPGAVQPVRQAAVSAGRRLTEAARAGRARDALVELGAFRLLCAHRRGPYGVAVWTDRVQGWLAGDALAAEALSGGAGTDPASAGDTDGPWYAGRPLLVTANDYGLGLYNGDTGVVVAGGDGRLAAVFERGQTLVTYSPHRLSAVDTVYAMTVHKSQGSQFATVAVLLPDPSSHLLTRELLYTAVTRVQQRLILVGTEAAVRAAVARPIARASGLRDLLWGAPA